MDWSVVVGALVLGLIASLSCLGLCIPILVPYIMEKDKSLKEGLSTAVFFSIGRLIIYLAIGITVFMIGSRVVGGFPDEVLRVSVTLLGGVIIIYGAWIVFKMPRPLGCPAKLAQNFRPIFSIILGMLIGSFFCWALWAMLLMVVLSGDFLTMFLSVIMFWIGSSTTIIAAGTISGEAGGRFGKKIGTERLRELCGMVLMMVGAAYMINGLLL